LDLGPRGGIKEVNTFSCPGQAEGRKCTGSTQRWPAADFTRSTQTPAPDPATCGWTLLAAVGYPPQERRPGGLHGVLDRNPGGATGHVPVLAFDIVRTEDADPFGNTFFSELDVIGPRRAGAGVRGRRRGRGRAWKPARS